MYKFVLDADGAIKLAKAGVLEVLAEHSKCLMPQQVYNEVMKGKEKKREDAFAVEVLVLNKRLKVVEVNTDEIQESLGTGEKAALAAFGRYKAEAIVSDDRKFLAKLEGRGLPFTTPANIIVMLTASKKLTKEEGLHALNKIKNSIREDVYTKAKEALGGK